MESSQILTELRKSVCEDIELFQEGLDRFAIDSPFGFEDGDSFVIILERTDDQWHLTDEGHTLMHLSYDNSDELLNSGHREEIFKSVLGKHKIKNKGGELTLKVEDHKFGDSLFTFIQALNKIITIILFKKDTVATMFKDDFKESMHSIFHDNCQFNYHNEDHDIDEKYMVDCYVDAEKPLLIFALSGNYKCQDAMLTCMKFKEWGVKFNSIGIFEESEKIGKKIQAQSMDTFDKQFSTLYSARDGLPYYLEKMAIS